VIKGSVQNGFAYLFLDGVDSIDKAGHFRNKEVRVPAAALNLTDGEVLSSDIAGFAVFHKGQKIGSLKAVENYGGGDFFEIALDGAGYVQIPNEDEFIAETDMTNRVITLTDGALREETVL
jgi:16S rRNA processing protein RimM